MPKLVRLYIVQVAIGFALSAIFVTALLYLNIANLGHLVLSSDIGWLAAFLLFMFNGIVFAGVQFAITIMRMAEPEDNAPRGPKQAALSELPVPVHVKRHRSGR